MPDVYQSPPILDSVAVELASFCRKKEYAEILFNFIQMRVADLKGVQEKATIRALREAGMDRISAISYHTKIFESYERCKRCRTVVSFSLPMNSVKAFTAQFRHLTYPRLRSYKQSLISVQDRALRLDKPTSRFWLGTLNNDPFFRALVAPPNMWVPSPSSDKVVNCRVLLPFAVVSELKAFLAENSGEILHTGKAK